LVAKNYFLADQHEDGERIQNFYKALVTTRTPDRQCLMMKGTINKLTFLLMQQGTPMQRREASHPNPKVHMSRIVGWMSSKNVRSDKKKQVAPEAVEAGFCQEERSDWHVLARMQKKSPWRTHQSVGAKKKARGKCCWGKWKMPWTKSNQSKEDKELPRSAVQKWDQTFGCVQGRRETMCCHAGFTFATALDLLTWAITPLDWIQMHPKSARLS
jgi:hypothetical protein